ncbi:MAG: hypothetical protein CMI18_08470 [Opitutaceae bacterium]|nr:hypothetical protein [Opitutaceae bacterium]
MKKLIVVVTAAILAAVYSLPAQDEMDVSMSVGYESRYVFRGVTLADESLTASIEAAFGDTYLGMWTNQPITGSFDNEFDFYGGMGFEVADGISMDVGGTLYFYPESGTGAETFEIYTGLAFDAQLDPAIYFFYDLDLNTLTVEGSVGHSFEVDEGTTLDLSGFLGFVDISEGEDYTYHGASIDVVKSLGDTASGSIGVRYSEGSGGLEDEIYFGGSITSGW